MHYDVDGRAVLFTQVFGRKRVMIAPPDRGQRACPMTSNGTGHWSSIFVENLDEEQKLEFARLVGAYDTVLQPGETLLIPTAWWHYIDYVDTGMSFNIRLAPTDYQSRLFAVAEALPARHLHYWQGIAQGFATGQEPSPELCARADDLLEALAAARRSPDDIERFGRALVDLYRAIEPDAYTAVIHMGDLERNEPISELVASASETAAPHRWQTGDVPVLGDGIEIAEVLANQELIVLKNDVIAWRVGHDSDPEAFRLLRALAVVLTSTQQLPVSEIAARVGCDATDLVDLLDELGETGCISPASVPATSAAAG
jgi:hypothetical protein